MFHRLCRSFRDRFRTTTITLNSFNDVVSEVVSTSSSCNFLMCRDCHNYLYCLFPSVKGILNSSEILHNMSSRSSIFYTKFIRSCFSRRPKPLCSEKRCSKSVEHTYANDLLRLHPTEQSFEYILKPST